jgi:hypothetical protein
MNRDQQISAEQAGSNTSAGAWGLRHPGMNNYFKTLLMTFCITITLPAAYGQGDGGIHGMVVAAEDGSSLPDATVRLEGPSLRQMLETSTNPMVNSISATTAGDYELIAIHGNFREQWYD